MSEEQPPKNQDSPDTGTDRGMPTIGKTGAGFSDIIWYVGGIALVIGILWLNFGDSFKGNTDEKNIVQKQEEQYRVVGNNREPIIPEAEIFIPYQQSKKQPVTDPMVIQYQLKMKELERKRIQAEKKLAEARKRSPMLVYSKSSSSNGSNAYSGSSNDVFNNGNNSISGFSGGGDSTPEGFYNGNERSNVQIVQSGRLRNQDWMIAQGTTIRGVLESAIQSDIAGYIRAIVSEDIYSFDGSQVLIPRGSKIIGRYQSGVKQSQSRLLIVWQRIIRPDGIDIMVDSQGTDHLGKAGLGGDVNSHFMERFGSAILLSMLDGVIQAGVNAANDDNAETVINGASAGLSDSVDIALENSINIRPTIHVDQGTPINIFVTKDMDFSSTKPKENNLSWWK